MIDYEKHLVKEAKTRFKKEFIGYAHEIITKMVKKGGYLRDADTRRILIDNIKTLQQNMNKVMMNMALNDKNPNYVRTKEFMPKKFNKTLFDNGDANSYDSEFWKLDDNNRFTILRDAIMQFAKANSLDISRKDLM